jgi:hypoxanthine phosphoribosyltransferase
VSPKSQKAEHEPALSDAVAFAHASERQFAKLLDFYQIEWRYEPTSFDLEWDRDGNAVQRFTPDFYLPAYDLYIEITTLNQKLVTRKNRKVRRLRELYPDIQCKIFYQRDYLSLVTKYGLDAGTPGGPSPDGERRPKAS